MFPTTKGFDFKVDSVKILEDQKKESRYFADYSDFVNKIEKFGGTLCRYDLVRLCMVFNGSLCIEDLDNINRLWADGFIKS